MRVLVTGGAGYIGSHTVRELVARGYEVIVLDTLEYGFEQAVLGAQLIKGDVGDGALLDHIFQEEKLEAVIHFAAYKAAGESVEQPAKYFRNNVCGTLSLLEAMVRNQVPYIIFSSSCSIFGTPQQLPVSEDLPFSPESPYAESKAMGEKMLQWFDQAYRLKYISLRYFNAAGAALDSKIGEDWTMTLNLIPLVMKAALGKAPRIKIFGSDYPTRDGTAIRDYIHVLDLAIAHIKALEHLVSTQESTVYNLGTGTGSTVKEVVETAKRVSGLDFVVEMAPRRPGDPAAIWADSRKAEHELNWKAEYTLETIIRSAWYWHRTYPDGFTAP